MKFARCITSPFDNMSKHWPRLACITRFVCSWVGRLYKYLVIVSMIFRSYCYSSDITGTYYLTLYTHLAQVALELCFFFSHHSIGRQTFRQPQISKMGKVEGKGRHCWVKLILVVLHLLVYAALLTFNYLSTPTTPVESG